jgi:hypothetical protein
MNLIWIDTKEKLLDLKNNYPSIKKMENKYNFNSLNDYFNDLIINKITLFETIDYLFEKINRVLYIQIRNNQIKFYYIVNKDFKNDWHQYLDFNQFKNPQGLIDNLKKKFPKKLSGDILPPEKWTANGCLLNIIDYSPYQDIYKPSQYINFFMEIYNQAIKEFIFPDCDLLINDRDFPLLRKDYKPSFYHFYPENYLLPKKSYYPLFSQSSTKEHFDIPIINMDDWESLKDKNTYPDWDKKINKIVFRGSLTGCYKDNKNHRYLWYQLTKNNNNFDYGITKLVERIKVQNTQVYFNDLNINIANKLNYQQQASNKYIMDLPGNSAAYRFGSFFRFKSVLLKVKTPYYLWFEPFLKDKNDYYLIENMNDINEILKLDNKNIANNGYQFYQKYLNKKIQLKYLFMMAYHINQKYHHN